MLLRGGCLPPGMGRCLSIMSATTWLHHSPWAPSLRAVLILTPPAAIANTISKQQGASRKSAGKSSQPAPEDPCNGAYVSVRARGGWFWGIRGCACAGPPRLVFETCRRPKNRSGSWPSSFPSHLRPAERPLSSQRPSLRAVCIVRVSCWLGACSLSLQQQTSRDARHHLSFPPPAQVRARAPAHPFPPGCCCSHVHGADNDPANGAPFALYATPTEST